MHLPLEQGLRLPQPDQRHLVEICGSAHFQSHHIYHLHLLCHAGNPVYLLHFIYKHRLIAVMYAVNSSDLQAGL